MLEQWIIDKLTPLKNEKLVILGDPQQMIRSGAQAVDGCLGLNQARGGRVRRRLPDDRGIAAGCFDA